MIIGAMAMDNHGAMVTTLKQDTVKSMEDVIFTLPKK